jgi:hypothetical protein
MKDGHTEALVRAIRKMAGAERFSHDTDAELIHRFVQKRDQEALAILVERHAPMVLGVCRRVLRDANDTEDAFQAVFLVLIRKARRLLRPDLLPNWLYGVARRTAFLPNELQLKKTRKEAALKGQKD